MTKMRRRMSDAEYAEGLNMWAGGPKYVQDAFLWHLRIGNHGTGFTRLDPYQWKGWPHVPP
jgi:hypothetical protein